jgi:hypothetical protein
MDPFRFPPHLQDRISDTHQSPHLEAFAIRLLLPFELESFVSLPHPNIVEIQFTTFRAPLNL